MARGCAAHHTGQFRDRLSARRLIKGRDKNPIVNMKMGYNIDKGINHLGHFDIDVEFRFRKCLKNFHQARETLAETQINTG
jgi:hypothetical protein